MGFNNSMITSNRNNRALQKSTVSFTRNVGKTTFPSGNTVTQADRDATKRLKKFNRMYMLIVWLLMLLLGGIVTYLCAVWVT